MRRFFFQSALILTVFVIPLQAEKIFFPRIVTGPFWETTFRIMNLGSQERTLPAKFYLQNGTPWRELGLSGLSEVSETDGEGEKQITVGAHGINQYEAVHFDGLTEVGYFVIDSDSELSKVSGFYAYYPQGDRALVPTARVGLLAARAGTLMSGPFDADTAISVINAEDWFIELNGIPTGDQRGEVRLRYQ